MAMPVSNPALSRMRSKIQTSVLERMREKELSEPTEIVARSEEQSLAPQQQGVDLTKDVGQRSSGEEDVGPADELDRRV